MSTEKLPEWPEELEQPCGLGDVISYYTWAYDAALARMEALVEYAMHTGAWCSQNSGHACTCGLSALLAACERKEAGR